MCTLMTFDFNKWVGQSIEITKQIEQDASWNADGWCLLLQHDLEIVSRIQTMSVEPILTALNTMEWDRFFLHSRYATQGEPCIANTHGFEAKGYYLMHNGTLQDGQAKQQVVDSHQLRDWLNVSLNYMFGRLLDEPYANVFVVDSIGDSYYVSRSKHGSLFTDGNGNYSTNDIVGVCDELCEEFYYAEHGEAAYDSVPASKYPMIIDDDEYLDYDDVA